MESNKVATKSVTDNFKDRVSEQYRTVNEQMGKTLREVVKFGALLNEVANSIGDDPRRPGSGLKGWLEANCPEVNYKTAEGYKRLAEKCAKMIGGGTPAIACLQEQKKVYDPYKNELVDVEAEIIKKRDELFENVDSRRKLEKMWFEFSGQPGKPGRPVGTGPATHLKALSEVNIVEAMFMDLTKLMCAMNKYAKVLMKNAPAIAARHPDECADFAQVAKDYARSFGR